MITNKTTNIFCFNWAVFGYLESYVYCAYAKAYKGTLFLGSSNGVYAVVVQIKQRKIPAADALGLRDVVEIYQALRPSMPAGRMGEARQALRLINLL